MSSCAEHCEALNTGNDLPVLHEIRHALIKLLESGEDTTIDLRAIPMAPGEEAKIESILGKGEVTAELDTLGKSSIVETGISGVWLTTHFNAEEEIVSKFIEVCFIPSLLKSQQQDIENGINKLKEELAIN